MGYLPVCMVREIVDPARTHHKAQAAIVSKRRGVICLPHSKLIEETAMAVVRQKEPSAATTRRIESKSTGSVRCEVDANGHKIITDEPVSRGGTDTGASPLAYLTTSLAACQTVQIIKVAEAMRFEHGAINIDASTTTDRIAAIEGDRKVMRFCAADLDIQIETNEPENRVERLKALSEDACPVGMLFSDAGYRPTIHWTVRPFKA